MFSDYLYLVQYQWVVRLLELLYGLEELLQSLEYDE